MTRKTIELEICAYTVDACITAAREGATRVELCSAIREGGLTPSSGLIQLAREAVAIQLFVMIRPRGGDFLYSDNEFQQMLLDIDLAKASRADGVVLGLLLPDGTVDEPRTRTLVERAYPMEVTFHRAFDMVAEPLDALEAVIRTGCTRILTSGGRNSAPEGVEQLKQLCVQNGGRIRIMAGSGVNASNVKLLIDGGVDAVHLSAGSTYSGGMVYRNPTVSMSTANTLSEYDLMVCDPQKVVDVVKLLESCGM